MKRYLRKFGVLCIAAALACLLGGCGMDTSVEELFTLPQMPIEYEGLADQINALIFRGYEYAAPVGGQNIQSVQMVDLDQDGTDEAVAFFRDPSAEKQLKLMVFRPTGDTYEQLCMIESSGSAIDSISYSDLNGDGTAELAVGWRISTEVQTLTVYEVNEEPQVLVQSGYTRFSIRDTDEDGVPELLVLRSGGNGEGLLEQFVWQENELAVKQSVKLSFTMAEFVNGSAVFGALEGGKPALFITGVNSRGQAVTDILTYRDEGLVNIVADRSSGLSTLTVAYSQLPPQDIDGDGQIEIPVARRIRQTDEVDAAGTATRESPQTTGLIDWLRYDADGEATQVCTTYHAVTAGWYFIVPDNWENVTAMSGESGSYERQVTLLVDKTAVLHLYTITGENREIRAMRGSRFVLRRQTATIHAAELVVDAGSFNLNEDMIRDNFHLIAADWLTVEN